MEKKWIMEMSWSETPIWLYSLYIATFGSWCLMWPALAYVGKWLGYLLLGSWGVGTFALIIIGLFFQYQYPRKK